MLHAHRSDGAASRPAAAVLLLAVLAVAISQPSNAQSAASNVVTERIAIEDGELESNRALARMAFDAFGQRFELELESNDRLKGSLAPELQADLSDLRLYGGNLQNRPGSWVRLAVQQGAISGVLWDGVEFFELYQQGDRLMLERASERYADLAVGYVGDTVRQPSTSSPSKTSTLSSSAQKLMLPVDPGKTIEVGFVADPSFIDARSTDTAESLLITLNVIDGIYLWQLGIEIDLVELMLLDNDPFSSNDSSTLLEQFSAFKVNTPELAPIGLVQLFTGREIANSDGDPVQGAATLGSVCDTTYGVGITTYRASSSVEARTASHEIAHNFGAPHDAEAGSACESAPPGFLMEAVANNSETFSECSIEQMLPVIDSGACFEDWQPNDLSFRIVEAPAEIIYLQTDDVIAALDAAGVVDAAAVEVTFESTGSISLVRVSERTPQDWTCDNFTQPMRCTTNYIPQGETPEFRIAVKAAEFGSGTVRMRVNSGNDLNPGNDLFEYSIDVPEMIDLGVGIDVPAGQSQVANRSLFYTDSLVNMTATVVNDSPYPATNVVASVNFSEETSAWRIDPPSANCVTDTIAHVFTCSLGSLAASEQTALDFQFRTRDSIHPNIGTVHDSISISVSADEPEYFGIPNQAFRSVTVTESISDLVFSIDKPPAIVVGEPVELTIRIENLGPDPARSVFLETEAIVDSTPGVEITSLVDPAAGCELQHDGFWSCESRDIAVGERHEMTATLRVDEVGSFRWRIDAGWIGYELGGFAGSWGTTPFVKYYTLVVEEQAPPPPDTPPQPPPAPTPTPSSASSGGGGAADWLLLLLPAMRLIAAGIRPRMNVGTGAASRASSCSAAPRPARSPIR